MKQHNITHLLLVSPSENDAVETCNLLRNNGISLSPKIISNAELFAEAINKKAYDVILLNHGVTGLGITSALKKLTREQIKNTVIIVIADETVKEKLSLFDRGVNAIVNKDSQELVGVTIKKEMAALKAVRNEQILGQQLKDSENRCQQLIDTSRDAIAYIHEGMHILSNDPYVKMFGYDSRDDIEAMPIMDLVSANDAANLKGFLRHYSELDKLNNDDKKKENSLKVSGIKENGAEFKIKMEFQPASMSGEDCIQIIIRNDGISTKAQEKLQKKLATLNNQCQETGLYNRRYFLELLEKTVEDAIDNNNNSYLLFIALDNFDTIKDKLGDINSDQIIVDIANLIKSSIRDSSSLARFESYRFSTIIKSDDEKHALQIAEDIRKIVDDHIASAKNRTVTTTCSIGITQINASSGGAQNSLTEVRKACAIAIKNGGNQVHMHVPDASEMNNLQLMKYWANEIEHAIKQKRMFLVFQPFVSLQGENSENFEVFTRLRNEQGDTIFPREFLTPVEATEHSLHIDRWVIAEAMRTLAERHKAGHNNRFIIKLTSASLNDSKFISWVKHNLDRYKLNADSVIFQTIALQAAENLRQTQLLSKQLHQLGCQFSFEHFGKEQNAFALLKHIKVDYLKLDGELVKNVSTNTEKLTELSQICADANKLKVKAIVPFVEEAGSLSVIWQSGAHYIQGHFLQEASESMDFDFSSFS